MVHVTVGTANAICSLMNAARDNAPVILCAGRTPLTETGHVASRNRSIHWGQEMFDQGGLAREFVKWDYELRGGQPVDSVVDRALDIAMSEPRGPVYLTLPREVLGRPGGAAAPRYTAPAGGERAGPQPRGDRAGGSNSRRGRISAAPHLLGGPHPGSYGGTRGACRRIRACRSCNRRRATSACRPITRCASALTQSRCSAKADAMAVFDSAVPWIPRLASAALRRQGDLLRAGPACSRAIRSANSRPTCW